MKNANSLGLFLSESAPAAITKCHRLGGLHNRSLLLTVLKAQKSKIKKLTNVLPREGSSSGLQMTAFCLHVVFLQGHVQDLLPLRAEGVGPDLLSLLLIKRPLTPT